MAIFLFVHGGMLGGWSWAKVATLLEAKGHRAVAPDLPNMGPEASLASLAKATLAGWAQFIARIASTQSAPVMLVGHSRAGAIISEAAELAPERIAGLIYVAAMLIPRGKAVLEELRSDAGHMQGSLLIDANRIAMQLPRETARASFFGRCRQEDADEALSRMCAEPIAPNIEPLTITGERWGRIPRAYVECSDDRALPLSYQRQMQAKLPCDPVVTIDSDHCPFVCAPEELTMHLVSIAGVFTPQASNR